MIFPSLSNEIFLAILAFISLKIDLSKPSLILLVCFMMPLVVFKIGSRSSTESPEEFLLHACSHVFLLTLAFEGSLTLERALIFQSRAITFIKVNELPIYKLSLQLLTCEFTQDFKIDSCIQIFIIIIFPEVTNFLRSL